MKRLWRSIIISMRDNFVAHILRLVVLVHFAIEGTAEEKVLRQSQRLTYTERRISQTRRVDFLSIRTYD